MAIHMASSTTIETTLYDVVAALNDEAEPHEEACVVQIVTELLNSGRVQLTEGPWHYKIQCA